MTVFQIIHSYIPIKKCIFYVIQRDVVIYFQVLCKCLTVSLDVSREKMLSLFLQIIYIVSKNKTQKVLWTCVGISYFIKTDLATQS
jgi:hypothetical protein